jgi:hypothetical protein
MADGGEVAVLRHHGVTKEQTGSDSSALARPHRGCRAHGRCHFPNPNTFHFFPPGCFGGVASITSISVVWLLSLVFR